MKCFFGGSLVLAAGLLALSPLALAQESAAPASPQSPMQAMMATMDADGDGAISAAEHAAGAQKMFEMADADHDGRVTHDEMHAMHARMMGGHAMPGHAMPGHAMSGHGMGDGECACPCCKGADAGAKPMPDDHAGHH